MLIAIEGIDASGKRTQTNLLQLRARSFGLNAEVISFPRYGETFFAGSIADYLNGKFGDLGSMAPHFAALLYAGDRFQSRDRINYLSNSCDLVIFDRYIASNIAYQAAKLHAIDREEHISWIAKLEYEIYQLPPADLTLYLDVPVETASEMLLQKRKRPYTTEAADIHERDKKYLATCREVYHVLSDANFCSQWITIPCTDGDGQIMSRSDITDAIWRAVSQYLPNVVNPVHGTSHSSVLLSSRLD